MKESNRGFCQIPDGYSNAYFENKLSKPWLKKDKKDKQKKYLYNDTTDNTVTK